MKIVIRVDEDESLKLSTENLDNYNYVDLIIDDKEVTVPIDELLTAVMAFDFLRDQNKKIGL